MPAPMARNAYLTTKIHKARKFANQSAFCLITHLGSRGVLMTASGICSPRVVAKVVGTTYKSVEYALKALKAGRDPGVKGHLPTLTKENEANLKEWCLAQQDVKNEPLSFEEVCEKEVESKAEHITIGKFIFTDGSCMSKNQLVLPLVDLPPLQDQAIYDHFSWYGQAKGWEFIPEIERQRAVLKKPHAQAALIWDGHTSHDNDEVKTLLEKHNITSFMFVPHATYIMQPLDLVIFCKFKTELHKLLARASKLVQGGLNMQVCRKLYLTYALDM
eukprot:m51a1_g11567 hypothetical protein (274) ;mRNA; f:9488-10990